MGALLSLLAAVAIILVLYFGLSRGGANPKGAEGTPLSGAPGEGYLTTTLKAPERVRQSIVPGPLQFYVTQYQSDRGDYPPSLEALEAYLRQTSGRGLPNLGSNMHYEYDPSTGTISIQPGAPPPPPPPPSTDTPPPTGGTPTPAPGPMTPGNVRGMLPTPPSPPAE